MGLNRLRKLVRSHSIFPDIDYDLSGCGEKGYLSGMVLNAGAGVRDISHLISGTLINQDIAWPGDKRTHIQIFSPIHAIPKPDDTFDTIVCLAVLEHVENPDECVAEMFRVLKPGGHVIASVPFMQPEHKVPTDFQRYTKDGLARLFTKYGFQVEENRPLFTVYHNLHWVVAEWLLLKNTLFYRAMRLVFLVPLGIQAGQSTLVSDKIASGFRIICTK
jgi:SAM-dependent methyltransferase